MTTPPPNVDQNNDSGANLNSTGDGNTIAAGDIHNHYYGHPSVNEILSKDISLANAVQKSLSHAHAKILQDGYNNLPSSEDRTRFRALGVLLLGLTIDKSLLAELWDIDQSAIDGLVYILELENLMKTVGSGLYIVEENCIRYANGRLNKLERRTFSYRYRRFISRLSNIDLNSSNQTIFAAHDSYMSMRGPTVTNRPQPYTHTDVFEKLIKICRNSIKILLNKITHKK